MNDQLLPQNFGEYINQAHAKAIIRDAVSSSAKRDLPVEHILLSGLAGCGKTALALLIAKQRKVDIELTTGGSLEKANDIYELLKKTNHKKNMILFIDEIHSIPKGIAEILYLPMEKFGIEISLPMKETKDPFQWWLRKSQGESNNNKIKIFPWTLIGATAGESGELPGPLRDRFGLHISLEKYTIKNMETIVSQSCEKLKINLSKSIIHTVAQRSCYTPRKANNLLKRIREHADAINCKKPSIKMVERVFSRLGLDFLGIDKKGREILMALIKSQKGALGLASLSKVVQLSVTTIANVYEPSLLQHELISYLPRGRAITEKGAKHLKHLGLI